MEEGVRLSEDHELGEPEVDALETFVLGNLSSRDEELRFFSPSPLFLGAFVHLFPPHLRH